MAKSIFLKRRKWIFPAAFLLICGIVLGGTGSVYGKTDSGYRTDILELTLQKPTKENRMPPALFLHDAHTEALKTQGCAICHPRADGRFIFSFKREKPLDRKAEMDLYHDQCIGCHEKMAVKGEKTGPLAGECRLCHQKWPEFRSDRRAMHFDRSLHYRHIIDETIKKEAGGSKDCSVCHHNYKPGFAEDTYARGRDAACQYCHKARRTDDVSAYPSAAHITCVNCHMALRAKGSAAGPVDCSGCHSAAAQKEIPVIQDIPRIKANQPDVVLMSQWLPEAIRTGRFPDHMTPPVAFDHVRHESEVPSCRKCHHASLAPCGKCHTVTGSPKGKDVTLAMAMHAPDSDKSCIGCHAGRTRKPACAGCHDQMPKKRFDQRDCSDCHSVMEKALNPLPANRADKNVIARAAVATRPDRMQMVKTERIPDTVDIGILSKQYQAVKFPHRKIVLAIARRIENNRLAAAFHDSPTTLCQGCHHHSPPSLTPPRCVSCHRVKAAFTAENRPDLKGAFHDQCITCHQKMGIEKPAATDCVACHKEKSDKNPLMNKQVR